MKKLVPLIGLSLALAATCLAAVPYSAGHIERLDPALDRLIAADAKLEQLADGVTWAEGPVWYQGGIVFSDVPKNVIYRWQEGWDNKQVFLQPSGQLTPAPGFREPGSNGLTVDREGRLLVCQCGERDPKRGQAVHFTLGLVNPNDSRRRPIPTRRGGPEKRRVSCMVGREARVRPPTPTP